jgi:hypothetical protein
VDLDRVANTPMRDDWRLMAGAVLVVMGLAFYVLWRAHKPAWVSAAGLAAMSVGFGFLFWAAS